MTKHSFKKEIDRELYKLTFTDDMRQYVKMHRQKRKRPAGMKYAAAFAAVILLGGTTVFAGSVLFHDIHVNEAVLPALEPMEIVPILPLDAAADEYGMIRETFTDYDRLKNELGIDLLDSALADDPSYMQGTVKTDNENFAIITVQNYILGDTGDYVYLPAEERYQYEHGQVYYSPVSLSADLILSESQLKNGWDTDYLGFYEYAETYTSAQGHTVHLIQDTIDEEYVDPEDYVSEKCAVFVADGIRYTLKGRTSIETMKMIVDTME